MPIVTLFSGINYTNEMLELEPGIEDLPSEWVKKVVSIRVPENMRIRLYDERKPSNSKEFTSDVPDLSVVRWANRAVRVNIEDLSQIDEIEEIEDFANCATVDNKSSFILILLIGIVMGLLLPKFLNNNNIIY
jgi:hypothetical protein